MRNVDASAWDFRRQAYRGFLPKAAADALPPKAKVFFGREPPAGTPRDPKSLCR